MALSAVDWTIVLVVLAFLLSIVAASRSHMRSVADFLAAGRTGGRYVLTVSSGVAAVGAITIVGSFEMNLLAGFCLNWWELAMSVVILLAAVSGWVIYRFRETRCLTLAQFFELRYSRRFRMFTGLVAFLAGIVNMGIYPAVEARFFLYYCGLPHTVHLGGLEMSTFVLIMLLLIGVGLVSVFSGGHVTVMITDFLQGVFVNAAMLAIVLYLALTTDWNAIATALGSAPADASLVNPFHSRGVEAFNPEYFAIGVVGFLYGTMSWQGTQAYNSAAKSAHEAKMAGVLGLWRKLPQVLLLVFVPVVAYTVLHHPDFATLASRATRGLEGSGTAAVQSQLTVPLVLQQLLPHGLLGVFAALMLAASVTTMNTYLHSWGSILVQDVLMPLRRRPFAPRQHLLALRLAVLFVAIFIFCFSLLFQQTQYIFLFFALTGAIFAGGSGAVILGGLYWRRGTTPAAWAAMIAGSSIAVAGVVVHQVREGFPINGQEFWAIAMAASTLIFVLVSLLGPRRVYDLERLLHRGRHADPHARRAAPAAGPAPARGIWRALGVTTEFTRGDRFVFAANYLWTFGWFAVFVAGTVTNLVRPVSDAAWVRFWKVFLAIHIAMATATCLWFTAGGFADLREMLRRLRVESRDPTDDGFVARGDG